MTKKKNFNDFDTWTGRNPSLFQVRWFDETEKHFHLNIIDWEFQMVEDQWEKHIAKLKIKINSWKTDVFSRDLQRFRYRCLFFFILINTWELQEGQKEKQMFSNNHRPWFSFVFMSNLKFVSYLSKPEKVSVLNCEEKLLRSPSVLFL